MHTNSAWTLQKGSLVVDAFATSYFKTVSSTPTKSTTYWDVQGVIGFTYASSRHLEFNLTNILYQDTHKIDRAFSLPSDLTFSVKVGSIGSMNSNFRFGVLAQGRLPYTDAINVPFEPYSANTFEAGIAGLFSYTSDKIIPDAGWQFHSNFGFWHHNDAGQLLTPAPGDTFVVRSPSRALVWGAGIVYPTNQLDFGLEVTGRNFLVRPPLTAYSREDFVYVTPSVAFRASNRMSLAAGVDVRVSSSSTQAQLTSTGAPIRRIHPDLPSYPGWRLRVAGKFYLTKPSPREIDQPYFTQFGSSSVEDTSAVSSAKLPLHDKLSQERRQTEMAEEELQRIRAERRKMEETLSRLRQILRGSGNTPAPATKPEGKKDN